MSVAFRTMAHFDQQQITDILHSMHFKNLYRQRGLATLAAFIDEYPAAFDLNKQKLRFLIKVLNDDHFQYYQEITALIDNCFDCLKQIDHDEYEFLMRLLFLIGSYGSLTLWQIVNWIQFNYRGRDVFNKLNKCPPYNNCLVSGCCLNHKRAALPFKFLTTSLGVILGGKLSIM